MKLRVVGIVAIAACHGGEDDCARAVKHVLQIATAEPTGSDERAVIDTIATATIAQCRREGLSHAQAACILAARGADFDDRLRACPAFAAKPPGWVIMRPTRDERAALEGHAPVADGPRESPVHYRQLDGLATSTCGLATDGVAQCWGEPLAPALPAGRFAQIAVDGQQSCGLDDAGRVHCNSDAPDRAPSEPFTTIAIAGYDGCGIRRSDHGIECWSDLDDPPPIAPPHGAFTQIAIMNDSACALAADHTVTCFGRGAPAAPHGAFTTITDGDEFCGVTTDGTAQCWPDGRVIGRGRVAISCWKHDCCTLGIDHTIACTGERVGAPPSGSFESVAMFGGHACAARTGGGTICWGDNDDGECNVPQKAP